LQVSHDARLITACSCELWVVGDRTVRKHRGGFAGYRNDVLAELRQTAAQKEEQTEQRLLQRERQREAERRALAAGEKKVAGKVRVTQAAPEALDPRVVAEREAAAARAAEAARAQEEEEKKNLDAFFGGKKKKKAKARAVQ
jgi:hypothetical protein